MRDVFFVRWGTQPYFDSNKGYTEVPGSAISAHVNRDTHWIYSQFIQIKRLVQTLAIAFYKEIKMVINNG